MPIKKGRKRKPQNKKRKVTKREETIESDFSWWKLLLKLGFVAGIWLVVCCFIVFLYYSKDLPTLDGIESQDSKEITQIRYSDGSLLTNFGRSYSNQVRYYELPKNLINAVVATEDHRFFRHFGIDPLGIARAYYANFRAGHIVQGGSTITQQLAKLIFLNSKKTFERKVQEVILALQLERKFTKEQIITLYLNRAYFGAGNYGVGDAAKFYFAKEVAQLNLNESAILAGLLKAPSRLSPKRDKELAEKRSDVVISRMIKAGFINKDNIGDLDQDAHYHFDHAQKLYFADFVREELGEISEDSWYQSRNVKVTTTLDKTIQNKIEDITDFFAQKYSQKLGKSQIAIIAMRRDGAIVGMSGGKDYQLSQFNRAINAKRQAGSAFKTVIYLTAFEEGFLPDDVMEDRKITVGTWLPNNYGDQYFGKVTLEEAFAKSLNSISVQLAKKVGSNKIMKMAQKLGITTDIQNDDLTIALGTTEISLLELTNAYATIANHCQPVFPYSISYVKNSSNEILHQHHSSQLGSIASFDGCNDMWKILRTVVSDGTGKNADVNYNVYGKTGTSQNYRDAWFIGFNNEYVVGVWIGNDDNSPTNNITGGSLPAILFGRIIAAL